MAILKLISIVCTETEDFSGADDPYLLIRGRREWSGRMDNSQERDLSGVNPIPFTDSANITLMEGDTGWNDKDDNLGTTYARASMAGQGEKEHKFTGDGADYTLTFEVTA